MEKQTIKQTKKIPIYTISFCVILLVCIKYGKILSITESSYLSVLLCLHLPISIMLTYLVLWYKSVASSRNPFLLLILSLLLNRNRDVSCPQSLKLRWRFMVNKCAREGVLKVVGIVLLTHLRALCKCRCLLLSLICNVQKVQMKSTAKQPSGYTRYTVLILTWDRSDGLSDAINCSHCREIKILLGRF